tara:strand:+ start:340 stop:555 length:216 start_codon:yes stop_codon:yes gene_type:complete
MNKEDEYHTVVISSLGDGKGKTETYYYGEAKAPIETIGDFSQMRFTKELKSQDVLVESKWRKFKTFIKFYG